MRLLVVEEARAIFYYLLGDTDYMLILITKKFVCARTGVISNEKSEKIMRDD